MPKLIVYGGAFAQAEVAGLTFTKGEPTPVPDRIAAKLTRNPDFTLFSPKPPPPATEPVVTEPVVNQPSLTEPETEPTSDPKPTRSNKK